MVPDPSPVKRKVDDLAVDAEEAASVPNKKAKPNARKDAIKPKTPNKPTPPVATPVVATSSKKTPTDPPPPPVTPAATPAETPSQKDDAPSDEPEKAKRKRRKNKGKEKVADKDSAASVKSDGNDWRPSFVQKAPRLPQGVETFKMYNAMGTPVIAVPIPVGNDSKANALFYQFTGFDRKSMLSSYMDKPETS